MIYWTVILYGTVSAITLISIFAYVSYDVFEGLNRLIVYGHKPKRRKL